MDSATSLNQIVFPQSHQKMKISTKFNLIVGFFFVFVFVAVFYSYCGGLHVCYSFPFFNGIGPRPGHTRVTMTSYILESKPDSAFKTLYFKHKHQHHQQRPAKDSGPPSYVTGEVAKQILRKANVSEEEANRELYREEKVDKTIDKESSSSQGHFKSATAIKSRKETGARRKPFNAHPIRKPPRRMKKPVKAQPRNKEYKALLRELERQENMTQNKAHAVENRAKDSNSDKSLNSKDFQSKSQDEKGSGIGIEKRQKPSKKSKTYANDAVEITDLQQSSKQAVTKDFDQLNKIKDAQSNIFEPRSYIIKISNKTLKERIRNATTSTLLHTHYSSTAKRAGAILTNTHLDKKLQLKNSSVKAYEKNTPISSLVGKKVSEMVPSLKQSNENLHKAKTIVDASALQSDNKEKHSRNPTVVTPGELATASSFKVRQENDYSNQNLQGNKSVGSSQHEKSNKNKAKNVTKKYKSVSTANNYEGMFDKKQNHSHQEVTKIKKSLAGGEGDHDIHHTGTHRIEESTNRVTIDGKVKQRDASENKMRSKQSHEIVSTKISAQRKTSQPITDINSLMTNTTTELNNHTIILSDTKHHKSSSSKRNSIKEFKDGDVGSGEEPKSSTTISLQELTRSVRNIKDDITRRALTKALAQDEQKIQKLASNIKLDRERRNQPFSLSRVLRNLVTKPDFIPEDLDDEDEIFKRSTPESNKRLVRVKRVKSRSSSLKEKVKEQNAVALKRVKRIDDDLAPNADSNSEKSLIRVKRKELDDKEIPKTATTVAKDSAIQQMHDPEPRSGWHAQADHSPIATKIKLQSLVKIDNKNNLSLQGLNTAAAQTTMNSKFSSTDQSHQSQAPELNSQTAQTFPNKNAKNIYPQIVSVSHSQSTNTGLNNQRTDSNNQDLLLKKIISISTDSKDRQDSYFNNTGKDKNSNYFQNQKQDDIISKTDYSAATNNINEADKQANAKGSIINRNSHTKSIVVEKTSHHDNQDSDKELIRVKRG